MWVGDDEYVLKEGDSITFESRIPHRWENIGRGKTVVLWAMTPPSWTPNRDRRAGVRRPVSMAEQKGTTSAV